MRHPRLFIAIALCLSAHLAFAASPEPAVDRSPAEVVEIVLEALQRSDPESDGDGLLTVYRFASPANRRVTGPLDRFSRMIRQGYPDMLNYIESRRGPVAIEGNVALQAVWLTTPDAREVGYVFRLGRQRHGEYKNMWMTDAVYPIGENRIGYSI